MRRKVDHTEIVAVALPVLVEAVAVTLFLGASAVCLILMRIPA